MKFAQHKCLLIFCLALGLSACASGSVRAPGSVTPDWRGEWKRGSIWIQRLQGDRAQLRMEMLQTQRELRAVILPLQHPYAGRSVVEQSKDIVPDLTVHTVAQVPVCGFYHEIVHSCVLDEVPLRQLSGIGVHRRSLRVGDRVKFHFLGRPDREDSQHDCLSRRELPLRVTSRSFIGEEQFPCSIAPVFVRHPSQPEYFYVQRNMQNEWACKTEMQDKIRAGQGYHDAGKGIFYPALREDKECLYSSYQRGH